MSNQLSLKEEKDNNNNKTAKLKRSSSSERNKKRNNDRRQKNQNSNINNTLSSSKINFDSLFETCNLMATKSPGTFSSFTPPPLLPSSSSFSQHQKEKDDEEEEDNKKIDEETRILSQKFSMIYQSTLGPKNVSPPPPPPSPVNSVKVSSSDSASALVEQEVVDLPSPPLENPVIINSTTTLKSTNVDEKTSTTLSGNKKQKVEKIKAIVKPFGDYVKLEPENVLINSKCIIARIHKVIVSKLIEATKAQNEKYSSKSFYERYTSSSSSIPKGISPSDSVFLRINGILSPSFSQTIAEFIKENPNETVLIEYFLQPTFG